MLLKMIVKILKFFPENLRLQFYRRMTMVPDLAFSLDFTVEIARSKTDLEQAYALLHECYVGSRLMEAHPSGLRCNIYTFFPHSTVIVVKCKGEIIGTVSLIRDSEWGLPSDKDYKNENQTLRNAGKKLVEVSALAVTKKFRNSGNMVSLLLMKYLYNYSSNYFNSDCLICTVHPKAEDFYKALWHFDRNGQIIKYEFVQGALAIHMSMEISTEKQKLIVNSYYSNSLKKNLALFVLNRDDRFKYPVRQRGAQIDPVLTTELFEYFCVHKAKTWFALNPSEKNVIAKIYQAYHGNKNSTFHPVTAPTQLTEDRAYRYPTNMTTLMHANNKSYIVRISDISAGGAFIEWPSSLGLPPTTLQLAIRMSESVVARIPAKIAWVNRGDSNMHSPGFGVQFLASHHSLSKNIIQLVYNEAS